MSDPHQSKAPIAIGTMVAGRYRVTRELGRGGMATVYEAEHIDIGKRVAIKVLDAELARSANVVERFLREARAAASVQSVNICDVYDAGRFENGTPFLVLELLEGESLYDRMMREVQLATAVAAKIFTEVSKGLSKAHDAGIIHRDLKPENIFLVVDEDLGEVAKILDFGLAKFYLPVAGSEDAQRLTREGAIFGTPMYMSPEQIMGHGQVDHRADLWALGCMVYECLVGRSVWVTDQGTAMVFAQIAAAPLPVPSRLRPDLPATFDVWFSKALARDPEDRFQTARDFARTLAATLGADAAAGPWASMHAEVQSAIHAPQLLGAPDALAFAPTQPPPAPSDDIASAALRAPLMSELSAAASLDSPSSQAPHSGRTAIKVLGTALALAAVATGGYFAWNMVQGNLGSQPGAGATSMAAATTQSEQSLPRPSASTVPPWVVNVWSAQEQLARGNPDEAVTHLESATRTADSPLARMMLDHVRIALDEPASCKVTGLGRPRPHDARSNTRGFGLAWTSQGLLASFVDDREAPGQWHAYVVGLDPALRPSLPIDITPEASSVRALEMLPSRSGILMLYGDSGASSPGLLVRPLSSHGRLLDAPKRVADGKAAAEEGSAVRGADDSLWVAYSDGPQGRPQDIFLKRLDGALSAAASPVRVTRQRDLRGGLEPNAVAPSIAIAGDQLMVAYRLETLREHDIWVQGLRLEGRPSGKPSAAASEVVLAKSVRVTANRLKVTAPSIACDATACFVAWRHLPAGASVAAIHARTGDILWREMFARSATAVSVAVDGRGRALVVWYENSRVRAAPLSVGDKIGEAASLGRIDGEQPRPVVVSSGEAEWSIGWSAFEGGKPETYVGRLSCPR